MSHGSSDKCEPNFTPLLDLVLQLVMFFMLCANFVMEQTSVKIQLPEALAGKPLDKNEDYPLFLNVNEQGYVLLAPSDIYTDSAGNVTSQLTNADQVRTFLKRRFDDDMRRIDSEWKQKGKPLPAAPEYVKERMSVVILRVHKECQFEKTYAIMQACRGVGYVKVQLRVLQGHDGGG